VRSGRSFAFSLAGALAGFLVALPALAGTAYVPFVAAEPSGTSGRATAIDFDLINLGTVQRVGTVRFVAAGENGDTGGTSLFNLHLEPFRNFPRTCCDDASGLLILSGAPQIAYTVTLRETFTGQPTPNEVDRQLPVVTAEDAFPAGTQARFLTIAGDGAGVNVSSLGILNLGHQTAHCTVDGFPPVVEQFFFNGVTIPPVSVAAYPDLLGRPTLGISGAPLVRCDQPFYPFVIGYSGALGNVYSLQLPSIDLLTPVKPLGTVP
jgi:hypothetical protein